LLRRNRTSAGTNLALKLSLLDQKIKYIFSKIKSCEKIDFAVDYFDLLDRTQTVLAKLVFEHEIGIPERLRRFVRDFDNLEQDRKYYFDKIKSGEYSF
jgi:hypothetical protein